MTDRHAATADLALVVGRFPESAPLIRRLFLADTVFRGVCEDYVLARNNLIRFQNLPDAPQRPEIAEYQFLIADLESEIAALIRQAAGPATESDT
jgi:hypothetical protein